MSEEVPMNRAIGKPPGTFWCAFCKREIYTLPVDEHKPVPRATRGP